MSDLLRLVRGKVVDPQIARSGRSIVVIEQSLPIRTERRGPACRLVDAFRDSKSRRLSRCQIAQIDVIVSVDIGAEGDVFAVGRELAPADFPLILREPFG